MKTLRLILGDQLNENHHWFTQPLDDVEFVMMEMRQETDYVVHHVQKVAAIFMAMRKFAEALRNKGLKVHYFKINDAENRQTIEGNVKALHEIFAFTHFEYQAPDEYRLDQILSNLPLPEGVTAKDADTEHFLCTRFELKDFFKGKKQMIMESFYRHMRKKFNIMLYGDGSPWGGQWNYDKANRSKWKGNPMPAEFPDLKNDAKAVGLEIEKAGIKTLGVLPDSIPWPIDKAQALKVLAFFLKHHLPYFGKFQDAMSVHEPYLFHSRLSFAMNVKLLHPLEIVNAAIAHYNQNKNSIGIEQIEGFVRQIIGWREYMRGIYWAKMPAFANMNFFNHKAALPEYYWTGKTNMKCMEMSIKQSLNLAYAHHIQRLMVTGNFALLAGIHPDEVDAWYLGIYIDAFEWVEITNTRGMSQFADGGIVGTKPYISSANYIHKMSDYCSHCKYNHKLRTGANACPFNSLYWNFFLNNADKLANNPRMSMMYRLLEKMSTDEITAIQEQATTLLENIHEL